MYSKTITPKKQIIPNYGLKIGNSNMININTIYKTCLDNGFYFMKDFRGERAVLNNSLTSYLDYHQTLIPNHSGSIY